MTRTTFILIVFCMIETATGGTIVLLNDPNACIQEDYTRVCTVEVDPNAIVGPILPPVPGDPNTWSVPAGKYNRVGTVCDPDGDVVTVSVVSATVPATVTMQGDTYTLTADLLAGVNLFTLQAKDSHGATREATIVLWAENRAPVLH